MSTRGTDQPGGEESRPPLAMPDGAPEPRRTATGWRVGDEEVSDLTSAMVLADLIAAEMTESGAASQVSAAGSRGNVPAGGQPQPSAGSGPDAGQAAPAPEQLQETVAQLERALTVRVRVEQAIGILAERHRLRPRQAFELLRSASRKRGKRVMETASEVIDSATNPLLRLPEELAKPAVPRRGRMSRRAAGQG